MKKMVGLLLVLAAMSACNTVQGAGEDLGAAGKAISNTAEKTREAIAK